MTRIRLRTMLAVAATTAVVVVASAPAFAGAIDDIWNVVLQARTSNDAILNQFTVDALSASTKSELDSARNRAHANLDSVYDNSSTKLAQIGAENPQYSADVNQAQNLLVSDHNGAHAEVDDIYFSVLDELIGGSTTTTTVPPTTTTTSTTVPKTTTTSVPKTTTTTTPDRETTTTTTSPATTTTTQAGAVPPAGPVDPPPTDPGVSSDPEDVALAGSPAVGSSDSETAIDDRGKEMRMERGIMSGMLESSASVVLPPMIVQFTVAPFIVLEVLFATLFESAQSFLVPFLILMAAVGWFVWRERRPQKVARA